MPLSLQIEFGTGCQPDPLVRIISVCQRRGCLIVCLRHDRADDLGPQQVTLVVDGDPDRVGKLSRWLTNLVDVTGVTALAADSATQASRTFEQQVE